MAIPTDEATCIAWHEAFHEPDPDGTAISRLVGVNGLPHGAIQTTPAARPTVETLAAGPYAGRRVYRFDDIDDWLETAAYIADRPFTIIVACASNSTGLGKRILCNGSGGGATNWLIAPRGEVGGNYGLYNDGWIDSGIPADTAFHVHTARERFSPAPYTDYRVDSVAVGSNLGAGIPGRLRIGGSGLYAGETANADVLGIAIFAGDLSNANAAAQEAYWATGGSGTPTTFNPKITQLAAEYIAVEDPAMRVTQFAPEVIVAEDPTMRVSQFAVEVIYGVGRPFFHGQVI